MNARFAAAALAATLAAAAPAPALAQDTQPRVVVAGTGEVAVRPDMATVTLSVLRDGATARDALDAASEAVASVIAALKDEGIEDRDLRTSGLMVQPQYAYPQPGGEPQAPRITGYQVTSTLTARIRDLGKVGAVIDRAVTFGVNQGGDVMFGNADPKPALEEARRLAVADARRKAEVLSEAAGVSLGAIVEITEGVAMPPPQPYDARILRMEAADAVPVEAGENTYRVDVQMVWRIGG